MKSASVASGAEAASGVMVEGAFRIDLDCVSQDMSAGTWIFSEKKIKSTDPERQDSMVL